MNGPLNKEQKEKAREIWGDKSRFRREYEGLWKTPDGIISFDSIDKNIDARIKADNLIKIQNLAHLAIDKNRILADKTVLDYDPCGYCPPDKRQMLLDTLREIIELTK